MKSGDLYLQLKDLDAKTIRAKFPEEYLLKMVDSVDANVFLRAATTGDTATTMALAEAYPHLTETANRFGWTALHSAVLNDHTETALALALRFPELLLRRTHQKESVFDMALYYRTPAATAALLNDAAVRDFLTAQLGNGIIETITRQQAEKMAPPLTQVESLAQRARQQSQQAQR